MIEELVREMTAEERAWLQRAIGPAPVRARQPLVSREAWALVVVVILTLVVIALAGGRNKGGFAAVVIAGALAGGYQLAKAAASNARRRKFFEAHTAHRSRELAGMLKDGRVVVKRVRAVAVVEIEPLEDEGTGYVFDLGDGRVLFLKGTDYFPADEGAPWPNTDFEIVRAATGRMMFDVICHGTALPPLRVVPRDDVDPQKGWDEREEVLQMSMEEAVATVLRKR